MVVARDTAFSSGWIYGELINAEVNYCMLCGGGFLNYRAGLSVSTVCPRLCQKLRRASRVLGGDVAVRSGPV